MCYHDRFDQSNAASFCRDKKLGEPEAYQDQPRSLKTALQTIVERQRKAEHFTETEKEVLMWIDSCGS